MWHCRTSCRVYCPPSIFRKSFFHQANVRTFTIYTFRRVCRVPVASISTFYRAFKASGYDRILKFRNKTQCAICHRLKAAIAHSSDFVEHAKYCDEYHRHLAGMFADRKVYASLRARAACQQQQPVSVESVNCPCFFSRIRIILSSHFLPCCVQCYRGWM